MRKRSLKSEADAPYFIILVLNILPANNFIVTVKVNIFATMNTTVAD